jgi:hypothetical protein
MSFTLTVIVGACLVGTTAASCAHDSNGRPGVVEITRLETPAGLMISSYAEWPLGPEPAALLRLQNNTIWPTHVLSFSEAGDGPFVKGSTECIRTQQIASPDALITPAITPWPNKVVPGENVNYVTTAIVVPAGQHVRLRVPARAIPERGQSIKVDIAFDWQLICDGPQKGQDVNSEFRITVGYQEMSKDKK